MSKNISRGITVVIHPQVNRLRAAGAEMIYREKTSAVAIRTRTSEGKARAVANGEISTDRRFA